jgi:hypothetical protein
VFSDEPQVSEEYITRRIEEYPGAGRLGRHVQHDPRSRRYTFDVGTISVQPVRHNRNVPIFDQGDVGSCTGNAAVGCIATDPLTADLPAHPAPLDEALALKTYSLATTLDDDRDKYPPTDTGSTGLAAAKALQQQGFVVGYQHTFSFEDMMKALSLYPVMIGLNWYDSFDQPDSKGIIKISKQAEVRGGHEVYADEIVIGPSGRGRGYVGFTNSWSDSWGQKGRAYLSFADLNRLLGEQGDVTVPIPGAPVVNPIPVPPVQPPVVASPEDVELYAALNTWAKTKGLA